MQESMQTPTSSTKFFLDAGNEKAGQSTENINQAPEQISEQKPNTQDKQDDAEIEEFKPLIVSSSSIDLLNLTYVMQALAQMTIVLTKHDNNRPLPDVYFEHPILVFEQIRKRIEKGEIKNVKDILSYLRTKNCDDYINKFSSIGIRGLTQLASSINAAMVDKTKHGLIANLGYSYFYSAILFIIMGAILIMAGSSRAIHQHTAENMALSLKKLTNLELPELEAQLAKSEKIRWATKAFGVPANLTTTAVVALKCWAWWIRHIDCKMEDPIHGVSGCLDKDPIIKNNQLSQLVLGVMVASIVFNIVTNIIGYFADKNRSEASLGIFKKSFEKICKKPIEDITTEDIKRFNQEIIEKSLKIDPITLRQSKVNELANAQSHWYNFVRKGLAGFDTIVTGLTPKTNIIADGVRGIAGLPGKCWKSSERTSSSSHRAQVTEEMQSRTSGHNMM